ncbi:MAG: hypothetical protein KDB80_15360 [Planctomycetes bacterium]|nr:hypothetical protein [Planctomycetota bacterium]
MSGTGTHSRAFQVGLAALGGLALASCGGGSGAAAPRVTTIPKQSTTGQGATFNVDLASFVTDREGDALTYTVASGGGAFAGSTYSNQFDTLGTYDVTFQVADPEKTTLATFQVEVTKANFAVVRVDGKSLTLLDTDTEKMLTISQGPFVELSLAGFSNGYLVFQRTVGSNVDLFAYDVVSRTTKTLGNDTSKNELYVGQTSDGRAIFTVGDATDTDLYQFNTETGVVKPISNVLGEHDRGALVNKDDLVFFESTDGGQGDIYYYDPASDSVKEVSTDDAAEACVAVLPNGGLVFSRTGGSGETDLYYYNVGGSVVQIGGDLGATVDVQNKTYHAFSSSSHVVFSAAASPTSKIIYFWNPSTGLSLAMTTAEDLTYKAISSDDVVVWTRLVGGSQKDIVAFDIPNSTPGTPIVVSNNAADETFNGISTISGSSYIVYTRAAGPDSIHVYDVDTPGTDNEANGGGLQYKAILENGFVVFRVPDGSAVFSYDPTTGNPTTVTTGLGLTSMDYVGAGKDAGDFVIGGITGAQTDLYLWDESAAGRVTVSNTAGNDFYRATTTAGEILFTRVVSGNTNSDLFLYDPLDDTTERLTAADGAGLLHDHEVLGLYSADRSQ